MKKLFFLTLLALMAATGNAWAQANTSDIKDMPKGAYSLDPTHTTVLFKVSHMGFADYIGRFNAFSGNLNFDPDSLSSSVVGIRINAASIDTNHEELEAKLRAEDAFNTEAFPDILFQSSGIVFGEDGQAEITGDLKMLGETNPVTLSGRFIGGGVHPFSQRYTMGFEASTTINRSDWGFDTWSPMVGDEVEIIITAEFNSLAKAE